MNCQYELKSTCSDSKSLTLLQRGWGSWKKCMQGLFLSRDSFFLCISTSNALVPIADEVRKKSHGYRYDFDIRIVLLSLYTYTKLLFYFSKSIKNWYEITVYLVGQWNRNSYQFIWIFYFHFPERCGKKAVVLMSSWNGNFHNTEIFPENMPPENPELIKFLCLSHLPPTFWI